MDNSSSSSRTDRKTTERNRRNQMKALYSQLNSLLPLQTSQELVSLPDQIDAAAKYIKKLQVTIEKMREKKDNLIRMDTYTMGSSTCGSVSDFQNAPQVQVHGDGSALAVFLVTGRDHQSMFMNAIRILQEEGVEIINASFCVREEKVFHTIHSKVGDGASGFLAARVSERLDNAIIHGHGSTTY